MLVAKVEVLNFFGITRDVLSNIELQKYVATDKHVYFLAKALKVAIARTFPTVKPTRDRNTQENHGNPAKPCRIRPAA